MHAIRIKRRRGKTSGMEDEEFIKQIMERPGIWMSQHPYYKFKRIKSVLWDEVHQVFPNYTVAALRKKWKTFYDIYRRELRRMNSLDDPLAPEMPQWRHFELLDSFLRHEIMEARQPRNKHNIMYYEEIQDSDDSNAQHATDTSPPPSPNATDNSPNVTDTCPLSPNVTDNSPGSPNVTDNSPGSPNVTDNSPHTPNVTENSPPVSPTSIAVQNNMRLTNGMLLRKLLKNPKAVLRRQQLKQEQSTDGSPRKSGDHSFLMSLLPEIEKLPTFNRIRLRNKFITALLDEINDCEEKGEPV